MGTDQNKIIINIYDKGGNPIAAIPAVEANLAYRDGDQESGAEEIKMLPIRELHFTMKLTLWQRFKIWWWFRKVRKESGLGRRRGRGKTDVMDSMNGIIGGAR